MKMQPVVDGLRDRLRLEPATIDSGACRHLVRFGDLTLYFYSDSFPTLSRRSAIAVGEFYFEGYDYAPPGKDPVLLTTQGVGLGASTEALISAHGKPMSETSTQIIYYDERVGSIIFQLGTDSASRGLVTRISAVSIAGNSCGD